MTPEKKAQDEVMELLDKVFLGNIILRPLRRHVEWLAGEIMKISKGYVEGKISEEKE